MYVAKTKALISFASLFSHMQNIGFLMTQRNVLPERGCVAPPFSELRSPQEWGQTESQPPGYLSPGWWKASPGWRRGCGEISLEMKQNPLVNIRLT